MAKKRRKKSSSKCPEPFNTLIDIAGGLAMGAVANHMEKKYHYKAKGKINPYAVSAMRIASGRMKSTEDTLRTGAFLGAMGSFDVEADSPPTSRAYVPEDPVFRQIKETKVNDNRYAWRLNCEDGSSYGISPYDYETKAAYNAALNTARSGDSTADNAPPTVDPSCESNAETNETFIYCRVSRLDNGMNQYFLSRTSDIHVGDTVSVPTETGLAQGIVIAVEIHSVSDAPQQPKDTLWIID